MDDLNNAITKLIQSIPKGKENRITRAELSQKLGLTDREVRLLRQLAQEQGYPVITSSGFAGCYLATEKSEIDKLEHEELVLIRSHCRKLRNIRKMKLVN